MIHLFGMLLQGTFSPSSYLPKYLFLFLQLFACGLVLGADVNFKSDKIFIYFIFIFCSLDVRVLLIFAKPLREITRLLLSKIIF